MSVETSVNKPIFALEEQELLTPARLPVSIAAVIAFVLGLLSILVTITMTLVLIPIMAIALGLVTAIRLSQNDQVRGLWLATIGLGLGILFGTWAVSSTWLRDRSYYQTGAEFAGQILKMLAENRRFEVYELTLPESKRQLPGVDLKAHYDSLQGEARDSYNQFYMEAAITTIATRGVKANWHFKQGKEVQVLNQLEAQVIVEMEDTSQSPPKLVNVRLIRHQFPTEGMDKPTASWSLMGIRE